MSWLFHQTHPWLLHHQWLQPLEDAQYKLNTDIPGDSKRYCGLKIYLWIGTSKSEYWKLILSFLTWEKLCQNLYRKLTTLKSNTVPRLTYLVNHAGMKVAAWTSTSEGLLKNGHSSQLVHVIAYCTTALRMVANKSPVWQALFQMDKCSHSI